MGFPRNLFTVRRFLWTNIMFMEGFMIGRPLRVVHTELLRLNGYPNTTTRGNVNFIRSVSVVRPFGTKLYPTRVLLVPRLTTLPMGVVKRVTILKRLFDNRSRRVRHNLLTAMINSVLRRGIQHPLRKRNVRHSALEHRPRRHVWHVDGTLVNVPQRTNSRINISVHGTNLRHRIVDVMGLLRHILATGAHRRHQLWNLKISTCPFRTNNASNHRFVHNRNIQTANLRYMFPRNDRVGKLLRHKRRHHRLFQQRNNKHTTARMCHFRSRTRLTNRRAYGNGLLARLLSVREGRLIHLCRNLKRGKTMIAPNKAGEGKGMRTAKVQPQWK